MAEIDMEKFPVVPPEFIAGYVWAKYHPVYAEAVLSYAKYKKTKAAETSTVDTAEHMREMRRNGL